MKFLLLFICLISLNCLADQEPSRKALLRIEVGQHSARINRLSVDEKGRLLATASDDKTVRLWNLPDGSPYAILRVPIGEGIKGQLNAVALSPDGKTVAAAGETGEKEGDYSLYLFDVEKRVLKARIPNLSSPILHLAYSKDGKRIAAAFSGGFGINVWDVEADPPKLIANDQSYHQERSTWLDFDRQGNLATVAYDGLVRVYDPSLKLLKQAKPRPKAHPYSIEYSASGNLLAVGYADSTEVDILSVNDLKTVKTLQSKGLQGKNLAVVAWQKNSAGDDVLLAGGDLTNAEGKYIIRAWHDLISAQPTAQDIAVADNILTDIAAVDNEKVDVLFTSADASWGAIKTPHVVYQNRARLWDARLAEVENKSLRLAEDGLKFDYPADLTSDKRFVFDFVRMKLELRDAATVAGLAEPLTELKPNKITQWRNGKPSFNGRPLGLEKFEKSYALAIDKATGHFLLGTEYKLRLYDNKGKEINAIDLPAPAYGVNLSGNGKLAIAALGDGSLHWYSLVEGEVLKELVTLFSYDQGKQWIVWTEEGFFGTSDDGGENLAGYHIDRGPSKRPEWVDFSQIYQAYYAPELLVPKLMRNEESIKKRLDALAALDTGKPGQGKLTAPPDPATAATSLSKHPPPLVELTEYCVIHDAGNTKAFKRADNITPGNAQNPVDADCTRILGPGQTRAFQRSSTNKPTRPSYQGQLAGHEGRIKLRYKVTVREGGLGNIDIYVNGKLQQSLPTPAAVQNKTALALDSDLLLSDRDNTILVKAYEQTGKTAEQSALVDLFNPPSITPPPSRQAPKLLVASVGIDNYGSSVNNLNFAAKDAKDFLAALKKNKSDTYSEVKAFEVIDEHATVANIDKLFTDIQQTANPDDVVLVYLSGHGLLDNQTYYFIPYAGDSKNLSATALSQQRMGENIAKLANVRRVFLFIDSCHAGAFDPQDISQFDKLKQKLGSKVYVLAASQSEEEALDRIRLSDGPKDNGLFALAVLEGMNGKARREGGKAVNNLQLGMYVQDRVDELSNQVHHQQKARFQQALSSGDIETFEITKVGD